MEKLKYNCQQYVELIKSANECIFHGEEMVKNREIQNIENLIFHTNQYKIAKEKFRRKKNKLIFLIESRIND